MQSDCYDQNLNKFITSLGFKNFSLKLVKIAFTHSSYTKENNLEHSECYERLEFLGDAVLKMATTEFLYEKFPQKTEGDLTKIRSVVVSDEILHKVAQTLNIEPYIRVSKAENKCQGHKLESIQACVMEALFGALYLTSDKDLLNEFIIKQLSSLIEDLSLNKTVYNAKAVLQEYYQQKFKALPNYKLVEQSGEAHNKTFTMAVFYDNKCLGKASAKTKKQAEQQAAYIACEALGLITI